jgi:hypothetical protein
LGINGRNLFVFGNYSTTPLDKLIYSALV